MGFGTTSGPPVFGAGGKVKGTPNLERNYSNEFEVGDVAKKPATDDDRWDDDPVTESTEPKPKREVKVQSFPKV